MTEVVFLTTEQVVAINAIFKDGGVRDWGIVDSATMRCAHTFAGVDLFPTIWDKAAVLLEGLASTQGFQNGNKRTAWTAMETFLAFNKIFLTTSTIDGEAFTLAVANSLIGHHKVVEWLIEHKSTS